VGGRAVRGARSVKRVVIPVIVAAALSAAAVAAVGAADDPAATVEHADVIVAEAANHGLDPTLLAAVVSAEGVNAENGGAQSELRAAAKRLRGGIDRHQSVVGALAAMRVGDERVSTWLHARPRAASSAGALPDARTRAFVTEVIRTRMAYVGEEQLDL